MAYSASNWYWNVGGSIYSSAASAVITSSETALWEAYQTWAAVPSNAATPMPSFAVLDAELARLGMPLTGQVPSTPAQLQTALWAQVTTLLDASRNYTVAGVTGSISCDSGPSAVDVQEALTWGSVTGQTGTLAWIDNNYAVFALTPAEAVAFATAVGAYKTSAYAVAATVATGIANASITTLAQIASASWPV